ncbi:hypothetical protein OMCYN_01869 [cyanobiont of Ornithocercus magnificus]|nr:hypothetical protein OMCYN_01869 [cyanobiont of Ornithocercus magnificus]
MPGAPLTPKKAAERRAKWIDECSKVHNNKYGYQKVVFVNKKSEVIISCPSHSDFLLTPQKHLDGRGCEKCPQPKKESRSAIQYKGEKFNSKEELARYLGISRRTLSNRIQDGWPEERWGLRQRKDYKNITYKGKVFATLKSLANHLGVNKRTLLGRIERGWAQEDWAQTAEEAKKHRARQHHEIAEKIAEKSRFRLHGLYKGYFTNTRIFCLTHYEIHEAKPANILSGQGIECCQKAFIKSNQIFQSFTNEEYDEKIKEFGKAKRIDDYINNSTPIRHLCLLHQEIHPVLPASILSGRGMKCCWIASSRAQGERRKSKAAQELSEVLKRKNPTIVWVGGNYKGDRAKLDFHCLIHDEVHTASPTNVKQGMGLKCCHRAASVKSGKKMGPINGGQDDNVWRALCNQLKRQKRKNTFLYLYESPFEGFSKYGISSAIERRAKEGEYGEQKIEPHSYPFRADAVLIEQAFKYGWGIEPPEGTEGYVGKTELTKLESDEFEVIIDELEDVLLRMGRWDFADEYCDPYEVKKAKRFLGHQ